MFDAVQPQSPHPVAVIGAGLSGARCAAALHAAGRAVVVLDKARGPGGRLATRCGQWLDEAGQPHPVQWDHGAPGFEVQAPDFLAWLQAQSAQGRARAWRPQVAGQGEGPTRWSGWPTQPALCHALLEGVPTHWQHTVHALRRDERGWHLDTNLGALGPFAAVVLALPPAQAAPLLAPHRDDWARAAALVPMQPCWTLMGVSDALPAEFAEGADWWPARGGPLSLLQRQGAGTDPGTQAWVAHASPAWSRQHLEAPADDVRDALQAAAAALLGRPLVWRHAVVHRWRYAQPLLPPRASLGGARWDAALGLGQCGDHLAGTGAEAAWTSGSALADRLLAPAEPLHAPPPHGRTAGAISTAPAPL